MTPMDDKTSAAVNWLLPSAESRCAAVGPADLLGEDPRDTLRSSHGAMVWGCCRAGARTEGSASIHTANGIGAPRAQDERCDPHGANGVRWVSEAPCQWDYWVAAGDQPAEILSQYADATGHPLDPGYQAAKARRRQLLARARPAEIRHSVWVLIHVDTDLGGDPDDACALAMLLGWHDVHLTAVTTTIDPGGFRAGCAEHLLRLARRTDVSVIAGAAKSLTRPETLRPATGDPRYWPGGLRPHPASPGAALDALQLSIDRGAVVVAIGPYTNLAVLELLRPGSLAHATVVVMGGWVDAPEAGLPDWGPERDWNVQWDTRAARIVLAAAGDLTLVTLPATLAAPLRARDLPRLRASGRLGRLLAGQGEAWASDVGMPELSKAFGQLPGDLLNFHYDPVTCAVAVGWPGAAKSVRRLRPVLADDVLRCLPDENGRQFTVVSAVDGDAFAEAWLCAVEAADSAMPDPGAIP